MKILHTCESYQPSVGGVQEVVKQLSERLVKMGHEVTVATSHHSKRKSLLINGVAIKEFKINGNIFKGVSGEIKKYQDFLVQSDFDLIVNFAGAQWATDLSMPVLEKIKAKKVFVTTWAYPPSYKKYVEATKKWLGYYDSLVYLADNEADMNFAKENGLKNIAVITNGADDVEFLKPININIRKKLNIPVDNFLILHVGSHTGKKGHSEAIEIFNKTKIKNATLVIAGNYFGIRGCALHCSFKKVLTPLKLSRDKQLIIKNLNREEILALYNEADLFILPSNIECEPIVLFESMASKTPFLTTDVGFTSDIIRYSGSGWLMPTVKFSNGHVKADIDLSVKLLEDIMPDKTKMLKMADAGFKAWQEKFTWQKIAEQYEKLYKELII